MIQDHISFGAPLKVCGLLDRSRPTSKLTQCDHLFTRSEHVGQCLSSFNGPTRFPQHLFQCRRSRAATLGTVGANTPEVLPRAGLTARRAVSTQEYGWLVTQSIATREPRCPRPHPRSTRSSPKPWMCHHTREPTIKMSVPRLLNFDRVHQPCLLPWRTPLLPPITAGCWAGVSEDCRLRTTLRPLTLASSLVFHPSALVRRT